ncbi:N-acetylglucosaminyldiphosphodolichol N-acetylglucosaminyltransferase catalytic subunit alg13 [Rhizina undulata]
MTSNNKGVAVSLKRKLIMADAVRKKAQISKKALVTTGNMTFRQLVGTCMSPEVIKALVKMGYTELRVQFGVAGVTFDECMAFQDEKTSLIKISGFAFKDYMHEEIADADLIISHAGPQQILDAMRYQRKLIVVPNEVSTKYEKEFELSVELENQSYIIGSTIANLHRAIEVAENAFFKHRPYSLNGNIPEDVLNEEMGMLSFDGMALSMG